MRLLFKTILEVSKIRRMCTTQPSQYLKKRRHFSYLFLSRLVDMDRETCVKVVKYFPSIKHASRDDLTKCLAILTKAGYPLSYVRQYLELLSIPPEILKSNLMFCQECGCYNDKIGPAILKFKNFVGLRISLLKLYKVIPETVRVSDSFLYYLGVSIPERNKFEYDDDETIKDVYTKVFKYFLRNELHAGDEALKTMKRTEQYTSVRVLRRNLYIMKKMFGYNNKKLLKMPHLLHTDPENINSVLKSQRGIELKESMFKNPSLMAVPLDDILKVNQLVQKYGVDPSVLTQDPDIYMMRNDDLLYRLLKIIESPHLNVYKDHPKLPTLLRGSRVASERLNVLQKLDMKCFNVSLLTGSTELFFRHVVLGVDRARSGDTITYVAKQLGKPYEVVHRELKKHGYLDYVCILTVKDNIEYLRQVGFNNEDIFATVQVLLYPRTKIEEKLNLLIMNSITVNDFQEIQVVQKKHFLPLTLYFIEKENNFSGAGFVNKKDDLETRNCSSEQRLLAAE